MGDVELDEQEARTLPLWLPLPSESGEITLAGRIEVPDVQGDCRLPAEPALILTVRPAQDVETTLSTTLEAVAQADTGNRKALE